MSLAEIQAYLRAAAGSSRHMEQVGPFLALFSTSNDFAGFNYAVPDDGADPTPQDVDALVAFFRGHQRGPRLEYFPDLAPKVEAALSRAGWVVGGRLPLMVLNTEAPAAPAPPEGIEVLVPVTDEDFLDVVRVEHEAYNEPSAPTPESGRRRRELIERGGMVVLARDTATGEPAGSGIFDTPFGGVTELAAVGVRRAFRRRGVAAAVTARLAAAAVAANATTVWLTPEHDEGERIYTRLGFERLGHEMLHISLP